MFKNLIRKNPVLGTLASLICSAAIIAGALYVISLIQNQPFSTKSWYWVGGGAVLCAIVDFVSARKKDKE
ncbi:MAG: hypothetical protein J6U01_01365 [Clostridia bacterium]|nr:hypothetical protein [Clostridia bacterium]